MINVVKAVSCMSISLSLSFFLSFNKLYAEVNQVEIQSAFSAVESNWKGPFGSNIRVCTDGRHIPIEEILDGAWCAPMFDGARRNNDAVKLATLGMYTGNLFSTHYYELQKNPSTNDILNRAQDMTLENYFIGINPTSRLATRRSYRGVSGVEYETKYYELFVKNLATNIIFFKDYLVQYELQRRFFLIDQDSGSLGKIRTTSDQIHKLLVASYGEENKRSKDFYRIRNTIHNQINSDISSTIETYLTRYPNISSSITIQIKQLSTLISSYFELSIQTLVEIAQRISSPAPTVSTYIDILRNNSLTSNEQIEPLSKLISASRVQFETTRDPEYVHLIVASTEILKQSIQSNRSQDTIQTLHYIHHLVSASYAVGLISKREQGALLNSIHELRDDRAHLLNPANLNNTMSYLENISWWAQKTVSFSFGDSFLEWTAVDHKMTTFSDDVLRASPIQLLAQLINQLKSSAMTSLGIRHYINGNNITSGVRPLNPGLAFGKIQLSESGSDPYDRNTILALSSTNAQLNPVAGIITKNEGNILSHVQLLARSLGVPNVVLDDTQFASLHALNGQSILFIVTPGGRVRIVAEHNMTSTDKEILADYQQNHKRRSDGEFNAGNKIRIDDVKLDLRATQMRPLNQIRQNDSGVICGPKSAFLGELRYHFPDKVSRGLVLPFGLYNHYYESATVTVPSHLQPEFSTYNGQNLKSLVHAIYEDFFGNRIPSGHYSEDELKNFISPYLDIFQESIKSIDLDASFRHRLWDHLLNLRLVKDRHTGELEGLFIRSDTNVEDLPNFNGAGLNKTVFNVTTFDKLLTGILSVWASPFKFRSFSWRQAIIDTPELVFPSILILETVPSEKSGVLITADTTTGDQSKMTIATAEGIGGTVDGTPAETLLYSDEKIVLLNQYKSNYQRVAAETGLKTISSAFEPKVLQNGEIEELVRTAKTITQKLRPERDQNGTELPWDIEYGFVGGKLFLFQSRPFVGNSDIKNIPALIKLDK